MSPFGSEEPLPSSVTAVPSSTTYGPPASATGGWLDTTVTVVKLSRDSRGIQSTPIVHPIGLNPPLSVTLSPIM